MLGKIRPILVPALLAAIVTLWAGSATIAQDSDWRVSRSSGDVWFTTSGAQPIALTNNAVLKAGDTVRTGQNGRALLVRGAESMLISANSVVGIPVNQSEGMSTTILQQAGTILLEVEKRNVQHFEVATPYLAAVVKGTKFQVTVSNTGSQVEVSRGQVQVTDYKSGQYALVNPGQAAQVSAHGQAGLSLSGRGALSPVQHGTPGSSSVSPIAIPSGGFTAPDLMQNGQRVSAPAPEQHAQLSSPSLEVPAGEVGLASGFVAWGKGVLGLNGRGNGDPTPFLAIPAIIGISVAAGAAVLRRRPRNKNRSNGR